MQHKNKRALSVQLPEMIIQSDDLLFDYCFYFALHNSHTGGVTLNLKSKYQELSKRTGYSDSNVRKYIKRIIAQKWAWIENGNLFTLSQGKVKEQFGLENKRSIRFNIPTTDVREIKKIIKVKLIDQNLKKQEYLITINKKKHLAKAIFGTIYLDKAQEKSLKKLIKYNSVETQAIMSSFKSEVTVSKKKIAQLFGRKSHSTGSRFCVKAAEYLEIVKRKAKLLYRKVSSKFYRILKEEFQGTIFYFKGNVYQVKCDLVSIQKKNNNQDKLSAKIKS